jgi:DNA-binding PadR family transcriptional regulator
MDVKLMLLGFLMQGGMTGYEFKKKFSLSFSFFSNLSYGSIYPALKKMEREGLISLKVEIQDGTPNRKVYTITDSGKKVFLEALRAPFDLDRPRYAFLTRLFFFAYLSPEERFSAAKTHLESIKNFQRDLKAVEPQIKDRADKYQYLCYRFGVQFFEDFVRNAARIVGELEKEKAGVKSRSRKASTHGRKRGRTS